MGQILTMRTMARMETYFLQIAFWTTLMLGGLALALTVSGLFSVLSYLVEQRTKEIGVRMALGATTQSVTRLVLSQSIRPVGAGLRSAAAWRWVGRAVDGIARRRDLWGGGPRVRPVAYIGSLLLHRGGVCAGRVDSCAARGSRRSGEHSPAGVEQRFANQFV